MSSSTEMQLTNWKYEYSRAEQQNKRQSFSNAEAAEREERLMKREKTLERYIRSL